MRYDLRPLDRVSSIKTKLGLLVAVTIVVASVLAVIGKPCPVMISAREYSDSLWLTAS